MSLLTTGAAAVSASIQQEKEIVQRVNSVVQAPLNILQSIYFTWAKAFNDLHGDEVLRPILLEKIGTNATELFVLNSSLTTFMISQLSGVRDDIIQDIHNRLATLPEFTFHPDGSVTVGVSAVVPELSGEGIEMPELSGEGIEMPELSGEGIEMPELSGEEIVMPELSGEEIVMPELSGDN